MDTMLEIAKRVDDFMMDRSPVHDTMRRLARTFGDLGIPFAIAGAMAANAHGHRRTTADVNILVRREDLIRFKDRWIGRGWQDLFEGSKGFRDTLNGVKIDVLIVGDYPGDGRPKPVSFPAPEISAGTSRRESALRHSCVIARTQDRQRDDGRPSTSGPGRWNPVDPRKLSAPELLGTTQSVRSRQV